MFGAIVCSFTLGALSMLLLIGLFGPKGRF